MARNELPIGLLNPENILPASFSPEKEFAGFVTTKKKDLELHYEPKRFEYEYEGFTQSTKPDFLLINLLTGVETYIEITLDDMRDDYDPKARQKKVMHMGHPDVLDKMEANGQIFYRYMDSSGNPTMEYPYNPSGSSRAIAGACDATGRVFGMMPHFERFTEPFQQTNNRRLAVPVNHGLQIAQAVVDYMVNSA